MYVSLRLKEAVMSGSLGWLLLLSLSWCLLATAGATRAPEYDSLQGDAAGVPLRTNAQANGQHSRLQGSVESVLGASDPLGRHSAAARTAAAQQHHGQAMPASHVSGHQSSSNSRSLSQIGPVYADVPGDVLGLDSILAAARDAFSFFEPSLVPQRTRQPYVRRSRALGGTSSRDTGSSGAVVLTISFRATHTDEEDGEVTVRLPSGPRSFNVTVSPVGGASSQQACVHSNVPYTQTQEVECQGMTVGSQWEAELVDADATGLILASTNFTVGATSPEIVVDMGLLSVETSFDQLAWAGMYYPRPRHSTSTIIIHAIIVGAQVVVYTKSGGKELIWDVQWTGSEGTTSFFLVPGARNVFMANVSVGETVLKTAPLTLEMPLSVYQDANDFEGQPVTQIQQQQLAAVPQLLCTGEVEDVRGDAGTFPQDLALLDSKQQSIYHPRGFTCRWQLTPDQPDVLLSVDYRGLLPDESIVLELAPNNIIRLRAPEGPGAVFQASVWVERSILVSFQTTRLSTDRVGAFSISWTSVASKNNGMLDGKTMVVVLSCVSAAGALLAACCFYFVCCGRRRRAGGVVVDGEGNGGTRGVQLLRVPSAVRELLPSKPYQAPETNPLPGADTEPDCCSICLVELEAGEQVTVLPCMHFYHKDCIGSWLKRNCTCPLCKNNVLEAFKVQQYEARQVRHNRRRGLADSPSAAAGGSGASDGSNTPTSSSGGHALEAAAGVQQQQHVEMTALHPMGRSAAASPAAGWGASRPFSPWPQMDAHRAPSPAAAGLSGHADNGDAVMALTMLPAAGRPGRLPPLQQPQHGLHTVGGVSPSSNGSWLLSLAPTGTQAAATSAGTAPGGVPVLVIPPSPSPAMLSLQSGTVLATPEDFAPAAAAAAALVAEHSASRQRSISPTAALADAAQASVAALRSSSRTLGRRLHVLLSPSAGAPSAEAGVASPAGAVNTSTQAIGSRASRGSSPLPPLPVAPGAFSPGGARVAVSIYAYAGHPAGADEESGVVHQQQEQQDMAGSIDRSGSHQAISMLDLPGSVCGSEEEAH